MNGDKKWWEKVPVLSDVVELGDDLVGGVEEYIIDPFEEHVIDPIGDHVVDPIIDPVAGALSHVDFTKSPYQLIGEGIDAAAPHVSDLLSYVDPDPNVEHSIFNAGFDPFDFFQGLLLDEYGDVKPQFKHVGSIEGRVLIEAFGAGARALDPEYKKSTILGKPTWDTDAVLQQSYEDAIKQQQRTEIAREVNRFSNQWEMQNLQDDTLRLQEYEYYLTSNSDAISILNQYRDTDYQSQQAQRVDFFNRTNMDPYYHALEFNYYKTMDKPADPADGSFMWGFIPRYDADGTLITLEPVPVRGTSPEGQTFIGPPPSPEYVGRRGLGTVTITSDPVVGDIERLIERAENPISVLMKTEPERIEDWSQATSQLLQYRGAVELYRDAYIIMNNQGMSPEAALQYIYRSNGLPTPDVEAEDAFNSILALGDPQKILNSLDMLFWQYEEVLSPHLEYWTGTDDWFDSIIGPSIPSDAEQFAVGTLGELIDTPLLGDFLLWLDKWSQAVYIAGAGMYEDINHLITTGEWRWEPTNIKELGQQGLSILGIGDGPDVSLYDTNEDGRIDVFEMLGGENEWGGWGVLLDIIFAAVTDPLLGVGVGGGMSRGVLRGAAASMDGADSAIYRYATKVDMEPSLVAQTYANIYNKIKTSGMSALSATELTFLQGVMREQLTIIYSQAPQTRRMRHILARNTNLAQKVEWDMAAAMAQLNRGGRQGVRYYGVTIAPTPDIFMDVINRGRFIYHPNGNVTDVSIVAPDLPLNMPTLRDKASEFGPDMFPPSQYDDLFPNGPPPEIYDDPYPPVAKVSDQEVIFVDGMEINTTVSADQIDWYNSQAGFYEYDNVTSLGLRDADGNRIYQGALFEVLDDPIISGAPIHFDVAKEAARAEAVEAALSGQGRVTDVVPSFIDPANPIPNAIDNTAEALLRVLNDEVLFPMTREGQAARQAYVAQFVEQFDSTVIEVMMTKEPSWFKRHFWESAIIGSLMTKISPRFKITMEANKDVSDNVRTIFNQADYNAAILYKQWVQRVFKIDGFGADSLTARAKKQWEALPDEELADGVIVPRSFEWGNQSLIAQFTRDKENTDRLLALFPEGTDIGDWLRSFDELRDDIWDMIPEFDLDGNPLRSQLDKYSYNPRTPATITKEAADDPVAQKVQDLMRNLVGLDPKNYDAIQVWVRNVEETFGPEFTSQKWFDNFIIEIGNEFRRIEAAEKALPARQRTATSGDPFHQMRTFAPDVQDIIMVNAQFREMLQTQFTTAFNRSANNYQWSPAITKRAEDEFGLLVDDPLALKSEAYKAAGVQMIEEITSPNALSNLFTTNYLDAWAYRSKAAFNSRMYGDFMGNLTNITDDLGRPLAILTSDDMIDVGSGYYMAGATDAAEGPSRFSVLQGDVRYVQVTTKDGVPVRDASLSQGQTIWVQDTLVEDIQHMFKAILDPAEQSKIHTALNTYQDIWARYALLSPAFVPRNAQGNVLLAYLGGLKNPLHYSSAFRYQQLRNAIYRQMKITGKSFDEVASDFSYLGTLGDSLGLGAVSKTDIAMIKELETNGILSGQVDDIFDTVVRPLSAWNPTQLGRALNGSIENNARAALYLSGRAQGMTSAQAAANVRKYLFDYKDLTETEQRWRNNYSRFYTFFRKNTAAQMGALFTMPANVANVARIEKAFEEAMYELFVSPIMDPIYENTPVPEWVANAGMRKFNGDLIGMDSPLVSAYQTAQALTAVPMSMIGYGLYAAMYGTFKDPKSKIDMSKWYNQLAQKAGLHRSIGEATRLFSTNFSGFVPSVITTAFNIANGQTLFSGRKLDSAEDYVMEIAGVFNPAIPRYYKYYQYFASDRDVGNIAAQIFVGLRVATEEQYLNYQYYDIQGFLNQFKDIVPVGDLPTERDLQQMGYMGHKFDLSAMLAMESLIQGDDFNLEEFTEDMKVNIGAMADPETGLLRGITRPPNNINLDTAAGQREAQYYIDKLVTEVTDRLAVLLWIPEEFREEGEMVMYPNGYSIAVENPYFLITQVLHMLTISEAQEITDGGVLLSKDPNVFMPEGEELVGSAPYIITKVVETVIKDGHLGSENLTEEQQALESDIKDMVWNANVPQLNVVTNLFRHFDSAREAGVDLSSDDFIDSILDLLGTDGTEIFINVLGAVTHDHLAGYAPLSSSSEEDLQIAVDDVLEYLGPIVNEMPDDEVFNQLRLGKKNITNALMAAFAYYNVIPTEDQLAYMFDQIFEGAVYGYPEFKEAYNALGVLDIPSYHELYPKLRPAAPELTAEEKAELQSLTMDATMGGILDAGINPDLFGGFGPLISD